MSKVITSLRVFVVFALLLGIIYPLAITGLSQFFMPDRANGSLIIRHGKVIGSTLIGQSFTLPQYFHGRFSAAEYDASSSEGSNLGPTNKRLFTLVENRIKRVRANNHLGTNVAIPADMVLSSGSGLDPHISEESAMLQVPRVAAARKIAAEKIELLIADHTDPDFVGIWGQAGVNVLLLNLALDALEKGK